MNNNDESCDSTGCALLFLFIIVCIFAGIPTLCYYDNKAYEKLVVDNEELLSHRFEVKEIFAEKHGNKPANSYIAYQCIVEDVETKNRVMARFYDDALPVTGDIWKVQFVETQDGIKYKLHERVRSVDEKTN